MYDWHPKGIEEKNVSMFPYTGTDLQLNFMDDQLGSFKKNKNDRSNI